MTAFASGIPALLTSFVGRELEIAELRVRLREARLLTLVGPGGVGKTRLALQLATGHLDGAVVVDLAPTGMPALVVQAVARALGLRIELDRRPHEAIAEFLAERQLVLVLDNCEHVIEACAQLVAALLQHCPGVTILATSREPLGIDGERLWRLGPLDEDAAMDLFVQRARTHCTDFQVTDTTVIQQICQALDRLPLAIELAAARAGLLAAPDILARLEDRFTLLERVGGRGGTPRHQTMRATLDWSHDLLECAEQQLFRRLAVFAGAFDLACAAAMAGHDTLNVLARLVDKSLVMVLKDERSTHYRLLDTLKHYAWERLEAAGEVELARQHHLDHFLERAEALFVPTETVDGPTRELDRYLDDLRSALEWCHASDPAAGLRLMAATQNVWWRRSCAEGRQWAQVFLARCPEPSIARARALHTAGRLEVYADPANGRRLLIEGRELAASLGDRATAGMLDGHLGMAAFADGNIAAGADYFASGLQLMEELGDVRARIRMLSYLAWFMLADDSRRAAARVQLEYAKRVSEELGDRWIASTGDFGLGLYWRRMDQPQRALDHFLRAIASLSSLDEVLLLSEALLQVARLLAPREPIRAARLAGAAGALVGRAGAHFQPRPLRRIEELRAELYTRLGADQARWAWVQGERMSMDEAVALALHQEHDASALRGGLSARELEIAELVANGHTSRQIAEILRLSTRTVESHLGRIYSKLGLSNRLQLTAWLLRGAAERGRGSDQYVQTV